MTLAGITTEKALFVLETLAADRRMALVYRVGHDNKHTTLPDSANAAMSDTTLVSWIIAPRTARALKV
jgi:hypothetical protein